MRPQRIVVLSFTRMGDLVQSTPMLRSLRRQYPESVITIIVLSRFAETAAMLSMVDNVITFDVDRFVTALDNNRSIQAAHHEVTALLRHDSLREIDLLINLSHTKQSATLCSLLNPRACVGMYRDKHGCLIVNNEWINYLLSIMEVRSSNPYNLVEIYDKLVPLPGPKKLELQPTQASIADAKRLLTDRGIDLSREIVALQPGASHPSRCWPAERYAKLAALLSEQGYQIVAVGDDNEAELAEQVCKLSGDRAVSLAGNTTVAELSAVLSISGLLVSNDTGTAHIAAAVGTPVLAIFIGPASAKDTAPFGNGHVILEADLPCAPCDYMKTCSNQICKTKIDASFVHRIAGTMLKRIDIKGFRQTGVIVSRTIVDSTGAFGIERETNRIERAGSITDYYRGFWSELLDNEAGAEQTESPFSQRNMEELERILNDAESSVRNLYSIAMSTNPSSNAKLVLEQQAGWQNELRTTLQAFPATAPFVRYLLVKCVLARTNTISNYYQDLKEVIGYFELGMKLIDTDYTKPLGSVTAGEYSVA